MMRLPWLLGFLLLAGCTLGPDYRRPETAAPPAYREGAPWTAAAPADALPKGDWWRLYQDPVLAELQAAVAAANPELQAAVARLEQARAVARISQANRLPRVDLDPSAQRGRAADALTSGGRAVPGTVLRVPFDLGYEIDLWGRVRRSVEATAAEYEASRATLETVRLSLHAELARSYFALRALDSEIDLLQRTLELRRKNLELVASLFRHGQVARLDLARAETELATATAEIAGVRRQRAQLEHALAVLTGAVVADFSLPAVPLDREPPPVAPGLPSQLLERRPDVATAERRLAAANARIGVAQTAFFPAVRLTGSAGWASDELGGLFAWDNRSWALGPAVSLPIFDGGRNRAGLERARAVWDEAVADYRQQVLVAFREVEDALADLRWLAEQAQAQHQAVAAAREAADISAQRYRTGLVSYLEVVDSERTALATERLATQIRGLRLQASVSLVKALGGGWEADYLATAR